MSPAKHNDDDDEDDGRGARGHSLEERENELKEKALRNKVVRTRRNTAVAE
jgi:hypothetical protein